MKSLNVTFTEEEYQKLKTKKESEDLTWHDFVLSLAEKNRTVVKKN